MIDSIPRHIDLDSVETAAKVLASLLATLWSDTPPLVSELLSLMYHNARERRAMVDWKAYYDMLPMHFLRHLNLDFNTWFIIVEEEAVYINVPIMSALRFEIDRRTLDLSLKTLTSALHPGTPAPCPAQNQAPSATPAQATTQPRAPRDVRRRWTPPVELLLPPGIGLRTCIAAFLGAGETAPVALEHLAYPCLRSEGIP